MVEQSISKEDLDNHLHEKLDFSTHIKEKIIRANRRIGLIRKL